MGLGICKAKSELIGFLCNMTCGRKRLEKKRDAIISPSDMFFLGVLSIAGWVDRFG